MTSLSRQTPRTTSKQPLREVQILHDEPAEEEEGGAGGLGWAEVQALMEDFELEAASYLRTLTTSRTTSLSSLTRHFTDTLSSLDPRVREMPLKRFVGEFGSDAGRALRGVVEEEMRVREEQGREGTLASARKRCVARMAARNASSRSRRAKTVKVGSLISSNVQFSTFAIHSSAGRPAFRPSSSQPSLPLPHSWSLESWPSTRSSSLQLPPLHIRVPPNGRSSY
ncbi:NADP transhydrogenase [Rhodotorula toruloides ATCC 204091]|uniref:NADP transhydrogenase n=1 Tax=Rhodotorula toruloides TaxID=5286 RepID=A0A0K3CQT9_RHOTO|nr:NADP transhydrogenase [Rhodotorula toruloides ATCC 204091]PRQ70549.1 NADP transhydrogenase [Rhodotorula toruloides]